MSQSEQLLEEGKIFLGRSAAGAECLELKLANRHGLVTGATGTGKTVTLQVLAEGLSAAGVAVFAADIKGDLSGIAAMGEPKEGLAKRAREIGLDDWSNTSFPTVFWDLFGEQGHPVRATVQEMGPLLVAQRPDLAIDLLQRGVQVSPDKWEYLHAIGFVHYWSYRNYADAATWLEKASEVVGAPIWLKSSAALMRAESGDRAAARRLWGELHDSVDDDSLRRLAEARIAQFDALDAIDVLNEVVWRFKARMGRPASTWEDLISVGVLRRVPTDPAGVPYVLDLVNEAVRLSEKSPLWPLPVGLDSSKP